MGGAVLLFGLVVWYLAKASESRGEQLRTAMSQFKYTLPAKVLQLDDELHYEKLEYPDDQHPRHVFQFAEGVDAGNLVVPLKSILGPGHTLRHSQGDSSEHIFRVKFRDQRLGELLLKRQAQKVRATIAVIIDDFGYSYNGIAEGFLDLPPKLTYSVIPGHKYSDQFARDAAGRGFEVMIHMPMEAQNDPGGEEHFVLKPDMPADEVRRRLRMAADHLPMAAGLNNHQGSLATENDSLMREVIGFLERRSLYFVDSYTTSETVGYRISGEYGIPHGRRTVFLDNKEDPEYIREQIAQLVEKALNNDTAIGIGHCRESTLRVLRKAIPQLEARGIRFARVSEVLKYPEPVL